MTTLPNRQWFAHYQPMLVAMANTTFGRELLCIPANFPPVIHLRPDSVFAARMARFSTSEKFANAIRSRWETFLSYSRYFGNGYTAPMSPATRAYLSLCNTFTFYPDAGSPGTTSVDGRITSGALDSNGNTAFSTCRGGASLAVSNTGTSGNNDTIAQLNGSNSQYNMAHLYLHFDTSSLGSVTIGTATVEVTATTHQSYVQGTGHDYVAIVASTAASNTVIATTDWTQIGSTVFSQKMTTSTITNNALNDFTLNATGIAAIVTNGVTKFALREGYDLDNLRPTIPGVGSNDNGITINLADASGTNNDPALIINLASTFDALLLSAD